MPAGGSSATVCLRGHCLCFLPAPSCGCKLLLWLHFNSVAPNLRARNLPFRRESWQAAAVGQSGPLPAFVNEVLGEHGCAPLLTSCQWLLLGSPAELSGVWPFTGEVCQLLSSDGKGSPRMPRTDGGYQRVLLVSAGSSARSHGSNTQPEDGWVCRHLGTLHASICWQYLEGPGMTSSLPS